MPSEWSPRSAPAPGALRQAAATGQVAFAPCLPRPRSLPAQAGLEVERHLAPQRPVKSAPRLRIELEDGAQVRMPDVGGGEARPDIQKGVQREPCLKRYRKTGVSPTSQAVSG